jgi:hypothetical protein
VFGRIVLRISVVMQALGECAREFLAQHANYGAAETARTVYALQCCGAARISPDAAWKS